MREKHLYKYLLVLQRNYIAAAGDDKHEYNINNSKVIKDTNHMNIFILFIIADFVTNTVKAPVINRM